VEVCRDGEVEGVRSSNGEGSTLMCVVLILAD